MRLSARAHLWILMGLAFAALSAIVAILFALRLMEARSRAFGDSEIYAASIAKNMEYFHSNVMSEAERLGRTAQARKALLGAEAGGIPPAQCSEWLSELIAGRPEFVNLLIYNRDGSAVCSATPIKTGALINISERPLFFKIRSLLRPAIGYTLNSALTNNAWAYSIGSPILSPDGAFQGAFVFQASVSARDGLIDSPASSRGGSFYLVDDLGNVVASKNAQTPAKPPIPPGAPAPAFLKTRAGAGAARSSFLLPDGSFGSSHLIPSSGWTAFAALPSETVYGPLRDIILWQTSFIALFGALAFFATRQISSRIERAARALARAAASPEIIASLKPTGVLEIDRSLAQIQQSHFDSEQALFERSLWQTASQRSLSGLAIIRQNGPDGDARVVIANPAFSRLCGLAPGQKFASLLSLPPSSALSDPAALEEIQSAIRRNLGAEREANGKDWDGATRHLSIALTPLSESGSSSLDRSEPWDERDPNDELDLAEGLDASDMRAPAPRLSPRGRDNGDAPGALFSLTLDDLTEISQREAALARHSTTDSLTGLPNRALFTDRLSQALEFAGLSKAKVAVAFLDIDRFKLINDTMGHQAGDWLITQTAARLSARLRPGDTLCRLGGDEFGVLLANLTGSFDEAGSLIDHMSSALREPFLYRGQEISISCSIGVALYPEDGQTAASLLQRADIAMFRAKDSGRSSAQFFSQEMRVAVEERLHMEQALNGALRRGEIQIHYQPKVSLATGAVVGMEALARWRHPKLGQVSPAKFIPLAEESDLITLLGREALTAALRDVKILWDAGFKNTPVAVNISARQIQPGFLEEIESALIASGLPSRMLQAEITESVILPNSNAAAEFLAGLTRLGVSVALDDFGTGWSSLSMLKKLPLSYLKMDRSFVDGLGQDPEDEAIAQAIISLAAALGLEVIAEGVETELQAQRLRALGAQQAQGFYILEAKPIDQILAWLQAGAPMAGPPKRPEPTL